LEEGEKRHDASNRILLVFTFIFYSLLSGLNSLIIIDFLKASPPFLREGIEGRVFRVLIQIRYFF